MTGLLFSQDKIDRMRSTLSIPSGTGFLPVGPELRPLVPGARYPQRASALLTQLPGSAISDELTKPPGTTRRLKKTGV